MKLRKRITNSVFVLLVLSCYLCETKFINRNDTRSKSDINDNGTATPSLNQTRNASAVTGDGRCKQFTKTSSNAPEEKEILQIIFNTTENRTVVQVRIPNANCHETISVETNKVVKLNFTREMLQLLNDLTSTPNASTSEPQGNMIMSVNHIENNQLEQYKSATIALAVACAVMILALTFLTLKYKMKNTSKGAEDTPLAVAKQSVESEYQSIRGLPRRETGNSYCYETVKPRLPPARPSITNLLQSNEVEYENLKSCDVKTQVRESNLYVPMDEALAGSGLAGSAVVLSGEDEDLYLTMKRLITTEDKTEPKDLGSI